MSLQSNYYTIVQPFFVTNGNNLSVWFVSYIYWNYLGNLTEACHLLKSTSNNICTSTQSHLEFNVFIGQTKIWLRTGLNSMKEIGKPLATPFSFTCNLISLMMETEGVKESNSNLRCTWHS